ncbi:MAG: hypothetical protein JXR68_04075 [Bacteroidales bacterium]|nr:hypothetical protein [Bacteroidales bacterium]
MRIKTTFLITVFFLLSVYNLKAQFIFATEFGATAGLGITSLSNTNFSFDNNVNGSNSTFSPRYGGRFAMSRLGKHPYSCLISIYGEYLFNNFSKIYNFNTSSIGVENYSKAIKFKGVDYIAALRYVYFFGNYYQHPFYADLGLSISNISSVSETNSIESPYFYSNNTNYDPLTNYNTDVKAILFGLGIYKKTFNLGIRFYIGIDDFFNTDYDFTQDGLYNNLSLNPDYTNIYNNHTEAKIFSAELKLEINIPFFSIAKECRGTILRPFAFPIRLRYFWK